ncbi:MAG: molybdopterin dinucleotide binding domain-containing protein [Planctomycetaceae bacterium]
MAIQFLLIPGRTSIQGSTLNEGKYTAGYREETGVLQICPADMQKLGVQTGDQVRMWNDIGDVTLPIKASKGDELPEGLLFISYGDISCRLMGSETHGSGMPDSKCFEVWIEPVR